MNKRKLIQLFCYYLIPIGLILYIFIGLYLNIRIRPYLTDFANYAFILVTIILFVKPLSIIFPKIGVFKKLMTYRRELGVLSFWFAITHALTLMYFSNRFTQGISRMFNQNFSTTGFFALIGIIILGITSNKFSSKSLKKNWKKIQYLAYPTFAIICFHKAIVEGENGPYVILSMFIILKIIEIRKTNSLTSSN